ncbi:MAG: aminotransferase class V-fold PLP-dependent enzyme, partial [Gemmatimonadota bacterium]
MTSRRDFVARAAGIAGVLPAFRSDALARAFSTRRDTAASSAGSLADDESYWGEIQRAFDTDRTYVNLNNGGVSPTPTHVLEAMIRDLRFTNELPVEHMWTVLEPRIESVRRDLAHDFGCDPEEMAIVRNASEALETMILGLDLERGDEVLVTNQNYGRMVTTWDQRVRREGIVLKQLSFPVPPPSPEFLVDLFRNAITPRTKVIEITHITNLTGQIFPVHAITAMARER